MLARGRSATTLSEPNTFAEGTESSSRQSETASDTRAGKRPRSHHAACQPSGELVERAWTTKTFAQYALHKLAYAECRQRVGLSAQLVVRLVANVADAYKLDARGSVSSRTGAVSLTMCAS
jgi:hypothetical protein